MVPRLPLYLAPSAHECKHAILARLLLDPRTPTRPLSFAIDPLGTNRDLFWHMPNPSMHVHHEAILAATPLPRRPVLAADVPWPLPAAYEAALEGITDFRLAGADAGVRPTTRLSAGGWV
jgi:hypothetical protein